MKKSQMKTIKRLAAENVLFAMEEIKDNLQRSASIEGVKANSEAMKTLSETLKTVMSI